MSGDPADFSGLVDEIEELERELGPPGGRRGWNESLSGLAVRAAVLQAKATEHVAERLDKLIELAFDDGRGPLRPGSGPPGPDERRYMPPPVYRGDVDT